MHFSLSLTEKDHSLLENILSMHITEEKQDVKNYIMSVTRQFSTNPALTLVGLLCAKEKLLDPLETLKKCGLEEVLFLVLYLVKVLFKRNFAYETPISLQDVFSNTVTSLRNTIEYACCCEKCDRLLTKLLKITLQEPELLSPHAEVCTAYKWLKELKNKKCCQDISVSLFGVLEVMKHPDEFKDIDGNRAECAEEFAIYCSCLNLCWLYDTIISAALQNSWILQQAIGQRFRDYGLFGTLHPRTVLKWLVELPDSLNAKKILLDVDKICYDYAKFNYFSYFLKYDPSIKRLAASIIGQTHQWLDFDIC
ncbi:hypothetical protein RHVP.48 [Cricetid gammaherpesvirus 2]|uniref:Uncharacterized protein n=1 Tax=Cricetid gammaherpesvirus 2 TaxID=1605972 RepID=E9M5N1_9GAMA|nr:hypothetical protein RHVP.48 [Cricetid gammaherpesvirus 2]ADW24389.1 hypothetical protein RHVP.48 [Cricetid gammaherpesvirus 2]ADW24471.1 hypothetical protein RHVP-L.48 [Cricetid gammaherpesvirus 2]